ncbi:MAG: metallophosphoesterase [Pseudomonadota bacterium]
MRVHAISDLHVDFRPNRDFVAGLSQQDYVNDLLIVAGDLTHDESSLRATLEQLQHRFRALWFVPGNHDLWVDPTSDETSLDKWQRLRAQLHAAGVFLEPAQVGQVRITPLLGWYDFSFGEPETQLRRAWRDFVRCRWPTGWHPRDIAAAFQRDNPEPVAVDASVTHITVSHFLPRVDLLPRPAIERFGFLLPVLGGEAVESELRRHSPQLHVYGHSHVPVDRVRDGVRYINNAKGYPSEYRHADRRLKRIA